MGVNLEIKGQLAKLLATEDLVIENKQVPTASFNVDSRVLTLPIWDKADNFVYDLLVGHEVGHALFTPNEDPDPSVPKQYVNVTEDARIEKLMKRKYMGLAKTFYRGYQSFYRDDFFELEGENVDLMSLADKVNIYFKIGAFVPVSFTAEEQEIVDMVANAETFLEAQEAAKAMYEFSKKENEKESVANVETPQLNQGSSDGDMEQQEQSSEETPNESFSEGGFDGGSSNSPGEDFDDESDSGDQLDDLDVKTDSILSDKLKNLVSAEAMSNEYVDIPKVNLDTIINSNKKVSEYINNFFIQHLDDRKKYNEDINPYVQVDLEYNKFKNSAQKEVNYLVKEFECRKSASAYSRSTVSRTGVLDCTKLHTYKYNEDLFKKVSVIPDGKNHGLIFILDWSGSMTNVIEDTIKQLYNLVWFCKKVSIPFRVYAFTGEFNVVEYNDDGEAILPKNHYEAKENNLVVDSRFSMMEFFTSETSASELDNQMKNIWRIAWAAQKYVTYATPPRIGFSGTPLNESIIALHQIIPHFKKHHGLEKVNCVILTDGEANHLTRHKNVVRREEEYLGRGRLNELCYLRDRKLGKTYKVPYEWYEFTNMLLTNLRDCFPGVSVIGIRVVEGRDFNSWARRYCGFASGEFDRVQKEWKKEKSVSIRMSGYHKYFGISATALSQDTEFEVAECATKSQIKSAFMKSLRTKKLNKKVLGEFVELIA